MLVITIGTGRHAFIQAGGVIDTFTLPTATVPVPVHVLECTSVSGSGY